MAPNTPSSASARASPAGSRCCPTPGRRPRAGPGGCPRRNRSWEESVSAGEWDRAGVWTHGDPLPGNLLFEGGRLTAVIDFGGLKAGDPACDLQPAWNTFSGASRRLFREAMALDDATWLRG